MSYRAVATVNAVVSSVLGLTALAAPEVLASSYGVSADGLVTYLARLLGGAYTGYAILDLMARDSAEPATRRAVAAANVFAWAAALVVSTYGELQGIANALGWVTVAMQAAFVIAWGRVSLGERASRNDSRTPAG
jgi:hypothetical protein